MGLNPNCASCSTPLGDEPYEEYRSVPRTNLQKPDDPLYASNKSLGKNIKKSEVEVKDYFSKQSEISAKASEPADKEKEEVPVDDDLESPQEQGAEVTKPKIETVKELPAEEGETHRSERHETG